MISNPTKSGPLTDIDIIAHYRAGTLLSEVVRPLNTNEQERLHERLAALHNEGGIDVLALAGGLESSRLDRRQLFSVERVYCGVIPRLNAAPLTMLRAVRHLVTQGNSDAFLLRDAFCRWIGKDPARAKELVEVAQSDLSMDHEILRVALVTLGDLSSVRSFLSVTDTRRQAAIAALGAIEPANDAAAEEALTELIAIAAADPDDDMRFTAIFAAFSLLQYCVAQAPKWVPRLVAAVTDAPSESTRTALLQGLWRQTGLFQPADAKAALAAASTGDLASTGLIGSLDATLSHLVGGVHHDLAIDCATGLIAVSGKALPLDGFRALEHRLMSLDSQRLFALAVRWFATGDPKLCEAMSRLIGGVEHPPLFDASLDGFGLTDMQKVVLCHKAIGFLLAAPTVAASFVVAALRTNDRAIEADLIQLLVQSLLINYGETVVAYLKGLSRTDITGPAVRKALRLYRSYRKGLDIGSAIKELHPSSYQRAVVRQKNYVMGNEMRKQAHRQSPLFRMVHRSTLLYGRKAITYAGGAGKPPVSMEMKTIRADFELPRLQLIDPVGLDWLLRIFQVSRPK